MRYINLIDELSRDDKAKIVNYIDKYGISKAFFVGVDEWLEVWSHANQKLYKLLGNKFIHKFVYEYEKDKDALERELLDDLFHTKFKTSYHNFYYDVIMELYAAGKIDSETKGAFNKLMNTSNFVNDKIEYGLKYKMEGCRKTLQLQAGMKPIRALQKVIEYFKNIYTFDDFEDFRLRHSMIFNDKTIKANLCISIHPLDYLTMSDNDSDWSSCMSWKEDGCYHVGTIEMMNSNNVLCCYLESSHPFVFNASLKENNSWNNKRWRTLAYATKDIIMSGKPYPYVNTGMSKALIAEIKRLAKENLNWNYSFGPELYKDMIHIHSSFSLNRVRDYILIGNTTKHNILWDTKGMYNDMLNDPNTRYWCYRNKVKHNKILSASGKTTCLCCSGPIIRESEYDDDDYNERYLNCGDVVCPECRQDLQCENCNNFEPYDLLKINFVDGSSMKLCKDCYKKRIRVCPDCGKLMYIEGAAAFSGIDLKETKNVVKFLSPLAWHRDYTHDWIEPMFMCPSCAEKKVKTLPTAKVSVLKKRNVVEDDVTIPVIMDREEVFNHTFSNLARVLLDNDSLICDNIEKSANYFSLG